MDMITPVLNAILNFIFMILQVFLYAFLAVFVPLCIMLLGNFLYRLIFKRQRLPKRKKSVLFIMLTSSIPSSFYSGISPNVLYKIFMKKTPTALTHTAYTCLQESREAVRA